MQTDTDTSDRGAEEDDTLSERLFFRADGETRARLAAIAKVEDRSVSSVIRRAVAQYLAAADRSPDAA